MISLLWIVILVLFNCLTFHNISIMFLWVTFVLYLFIGRLNWKYNVFNLIFLSFSYRFSTCETKVFLGCTLKGVTTRYISILTLYSCHLLIFGHIKGEFYVYVVAFQLKRFSVKSFKKKYFTHLVHRIYETFLITICMLHRH